MLTLEKLESREPLVFENGGLRIFGVLHRPTEIENPPLVIMLHGFASSKVGTARGHVKIATSLIEAGIAVLRFDLRGHGDSEGELGHLGLLDLVQDALLVIDEMTAKGFQEIGLYGSSLGGSIASLAASARPEIKRVALWAPVASGELWARDFLSRGQTELTSYRGATISPAFREQFLQMKAFQAIGARSDLALLHGMGGADEVLSQDHKRLFERSAPQGRFLHYPSASHYLGVSSCQREFIKELVSWFSASFSRSA